MTPIAVPLVVCLAEPPHRLVNFSELDLIHINIEVVKGVIFQGLA